ncbi:MAG: nucleotidyl transferase AbiEii/AbiGii toxin family protein [Elusimicrobiota bacterium]
MKEVLRMIYEDPILRHCLVLIGGTAINLAITDIPRLSVDIDLDYIHNNGKIFDHEFIEEHADIFMRIAKEINMDYYRTTDIESNRLGIAFHYKSNFIPAGEGTVKLDISYLLKTTIFKPIKSSIYKLGSFDIFNDLPILIASPFELWSGKALALVYRSSKDPKPEDVAELYSMFISRHLFDIHKFEKSLVSGDISIDENMLRNAFIFKGAPRIKDFFLLRGEQLHKCSQSEVDRQLYPYLRGEERPTLDEMKISSRHFLNRVCSNSWNEQQEGFVEEFQRLGSYNPQLLFGKDNPDFSHLYKNEYMINIADSFKK